jgi:hypothetical protein
MAAPLSAASLFSMEKEDTIFSMEASMAANAGAAFLSALAYWARNSVGAFCDAPKLVFSFLCKPKKQTISC